MQKCRESNDLRSTKSSELFVEYTTNNPVRFSLANNAKQIFLAAVDSIDTTEERSVYIGDYGTADGGASYPLIEAAINVLQKRNGENQSIVIIYEDLVSTNFNAIFWRCQGILPQNINCLSNYQNVFPLANAISMYELCMPPSSMDIIYTAMTVHYLSQRPCYLKDSLTSVTTDDPEEAELFRSRAESDWNSFLMCRARELRPGGHVVAVGHEGKRRYAFYLLMDAAWRKLFLSKRITKEEYTKASFTFYHRSVDEYTKPFEDKDSEIRKAGLELKKIFTREVLKPDYSTASTEDEVQSMAEKYLLDARRWTEDTLREGLNTSRTNQNKDNLMDEFYSELSEIVLQNPRKYAENNMFAFILIRKCSKHDPN